MAVYKPTDCSPFNGTFDVVQDLPIFFECKVDTSNSQVTAYTIEIYDNDNNLIFPKNADESLMNRLSFVDELSTYVRRYYPERSFGTPNVNSGLNGTYLEIPVVVKTKADNTVARNQLLSDDISNGRGYRWKITLYQKASKDGLPKDIKYYDILIAQGVVLGSTAERLHTALIYGDPQVVKDLALINKFVQLGKSNISQINLSSPVATYQSDGFQPVGTRASISNYTSTYGYIYPSTVDGASLADGQISRDVCDSFQIFKQNNNPALLSAADMVNFVFEGAISDTQPLATGPDGNSWKWVDNLADPTTSYWEETYEVDLKPDGAYYPLGISYPLYGNERVVFNNVQKGAARASLAGTYCGSPYNGVFLPTFLSKEGESSGKFTVTVRWNRAPDLSSWGSLIRKVLYVQSGDLGGQNIEINTRSIYGQINQTPFMFVTESPIRLFNTAQAIIETVQIPAGSKGELVTEKLKSPIADILSVKTNGRLVSAANYIFTQNRRFITYTKQTSASETLIIEYVPYVSRDYQGVLFYNATADSRYYDTDNDVVFIRPSLNAQQGMAIRWPENNWFNIAKYNLKYSYVEREGGSSISTMESDTTRYSILSFYQESDLNPFTLYATPTINYVVSVNNEPVELDATGAYLVGARGFTITANYEQDNYIQWQSFQWTLWDASKTMLLDKSDEIYDGEISAEFRGLENNTTYVVALLIQNNAGKIVSQNVTIRTEFNESEALPDMVEAVLDCDNLAVKASITLPDKKLVVAPDANQYMDVPPTELSKGESAYVWNPESSAVYYVGDDANVPKVVASIQNAVLNINPAHTLSFSKFFKEYNITNDTAIAPIEVSGEMVIENEFLFPANFSGEFFSVSQDDDTRRRGFSIPDYETDGVISDDAYRIQYKNGDNKTESIKIVRQDGSESDTWGFAYLVSNWVKDSEDNPDFGDIANVGDYAKAQVVENDEVTDKYYNINGPFNSYDANHPLTEDGELWLDEKPADKIKNVITKATLSDGSTTTPKCVSLGYSSIWDDERVDDGNANWKDSDTTYLTYQKQVPSKIQGAKELEKYRFVFRIFIDTDKMLVLDKSRCYIFNRVQLDKPVVEIVDKKLAQWAPVENAETYKIYLAGTYIGEVDVQ